MKTVSESSRGPLYLDSSALVKLYLPEKESAALDQRLRGRTDLMVSQLCFTEVISAAARRRREGLLDDAQVARILRAMLDGATAGHFIVLDITTDVHRRAEQLLMISETTLRTADALHLALASLAGAGEIVTFDQHLGAAARRLGL